MNMKNILKTTISMVIAMVAVLGMTTISQAYSVGQELNIGYNDYIGNGNMYCLEHNQKLRARRQPYTVVSNVKIEGTKSTDHTGKTIDNTANAVFAYILNKNERILLWSDLIWQRRQNSLLKTRIIEEFP